MKFIYSIFAVAALCLFSCGNDATEDASKEEAKCLYNYNHNSTELNWTAYKTTAKVGVSGGFNVINVKSESAYSVKEVLESISFEIETNSVETNDEGRNKKIDSLFFGFRNVDKITGKISKIKDDGKAIIMITMGGISIDIEGDYTLEGTQFSFSSEINLLSWNLIGAANNLNAACEDLHKGDDGVSKLWDIVNLTFTTTLTSECNN